MPIERPFHQSPNWRQRQGRGSHPVPDLRLACPHCGSAATHGHGFFRWKDGTRRRRFICRACGRTFNRHTGTPLHYIKKRKEWSLQVGGLGQGLSVRRMAAAVGVRIPTAFRWRHGILSALARRPQSKLTGHTAISDVYVPYSEKGSRKTLGPGAWRLETHVGHGTAPPSQPRFRRFVDGKAACVLLVCSRSRQAAMMAGQGRPTASHVGACLLSLLAPGAEVRSEGKPAFAEACRHHNFANREWLNPGTLGGRGSLGNQLSQLAAQLFGWLWRFRGVATKYLPNYLAWLKYARLDLNHSRLEPGLRMMAQAV